MSLILKSDQVSKNTLFDINNMTGNADFNTYLDFTRDTYLQRVNSNLVDTPLNDLINVARFGAASYTNNNNESLVANPNTPRISYIDKSSIRGLLIENNSTNLLSNPDAPVSQTVVVSEVAANTRGLVLAIEGSGSATMTGTNLGTANRATATQGNPIAVLMLSSTSSTLTITFTGSVTKAYLINPPYKFGGTYAKEAFPVGVATLDKDTVTAKPLFIQKLEAAQTIVYQVALKPRDVINATNGYDVELLTISNTETANKDNIIVKGTVFADGRLVVTLSSNSKPSGGTYSVKTVTLNTNLPESGIVTIALTYDSTYQNIDIAINGASAKLAGSTNAMVLNQLQLSGGVAPLGGVVTHLVLYNSKSSEVDLLKLSERWY